MAPVSSPLLLRLVDITMTVAPPACAAPGAGGRGGRGDAHGGGGPGED